MADRCSTPETPRDVPITENLIAPIASVVRSMPPTGVARAMMSLGIVLRVKLVRLVPLLGSFLFSHQLVQQKPCNLLIEGHHKSFPSLAREVLH